jgi:hypothetical protein
VQSTRFGKSNQSPSTQSVVSQHAGWPCRLQLSKPAGFVSRPFGPTGDRLSGAKKKSKYLTNGGPMGYKVIRIITNFYFNELRGIEVVL